VGADGVTFVLREGDNVYYAEENAIGPLWKGRRFPATQCISGWVMLNGRAAVIENIYEDERIPIDAYRPTFVKSLAMMPVRSSDPIGAIGAYWAVHHKASRAEIETLQWIADATALSMQNAQLYSDLERAVEREHAARIAAEDASRSKDEWLSVVSHELRTPLTPVFGWLHLLQARPCDASTKNALDIIKRNLVAHMRVIDALIDASKILSMTFDLRAAVIDLRECTSSAIENQRIIAEGKGIALKETSGDEPVIVRGDPDRISQIIDNLLENAIKFTPPDGEIHVSIGNGSGFAEITVEDTGVGIPPEALPRLFKRFQQIDGSSTRSVGGLGLGLWIVRELAQLHGGTATAHSLGLNKGARFTVKLPLMNAD
jgi:two-component system CheB/CheR fusion protein